LAKLLDPLFLLRTADRSIFLTHLKRVLSERLSSLGCNLYTLLSICAFSDYTVTTDSDIPVLEFISTRFHSTSAKYLNLVYLLRILHRSVDSIQGGRDVNLAIAKSAIKLFFQCLSGFPVHWADYCAFESSAIFCKVAKSLRNLKEIDDRLELDNIMGIVRSSTESWTVPFSALTLADLFLPGHNSLAESVALLSSVDVSRLDSVFRIVYHINTLFGRDIEYDPGILTTLFRWHIQYVFGEELGLIQVYNVIFLVNHLRLARRFSVSGSIELFDFTLRSLYGDLHFDSQTSLLELN
jgi:hypothetical protein